MRKCGLHPEASDRRALERASTDDLVRDGIYARFFAGCIRDGIHLRDCLLLVVEAGAVVQDGDKSMRAIERYLVDRSGSLPKRINLSGKSVRRACDFVQRLIGIEVFVETRNGKWGLTDLGRLLWEEAVLWQRAGLLETRDNLDFPAIPGLSRPMVDNNPIGGAGAAICRRAG